jgi:hypothetical protein
MALTLTCPSAASATGMSFATAGKTRARGRKKGSPREAWCDYVHMNPVWPASRKNGGATRTAAALVHHPARHGSQSRSDGTGGIP